jgi:hypothetical protein
MEMHPNLLRTIWLLVLPICLGCRTKVVLVPSGDPIMLAEPTRASVYAFDRDGKLVGPSTVKIPAGWYALPKAK